MSQPEPASTTKAKVRDYTVLCSKDGANWISMLATFPGSNQEQACDAARISLGADWQGPEILWEARADWNPKVYGRKISYEFMTAKQARERAEAEVKENPPERERKGGGDDA